MELKKVTVGTYGQTDLFILAIGQIISKMEWESRYLQLAKNRLVYGLMDNMLTNQIDFHFY